MLDILRQLNWVDIVIAVLVIRICYISIKSGFPVEIFKLLGTLCAIYLSLHYYLVLGDMLGGISFVSAIPKAYFDFLCFLILALIGYLLFFLLRAIFYHFIDLKAVPALSKWGGFIAGLARAALLIGLIVFIFSISTVGYLQSSADNSYIGSRFSKVAPLTYAWIWNNITSKFAKNEKFNAFALLSK